MQLILCICLPLCPSPARVSPLHNGESLSTWSLGVFPAHLRHQVPYEVLRQLARRAEQAGRNTGCRSTGTSAPGEAFRLNQHQRLAVHAGSTAAGEACCSALSRLQHAAAGGLRQLAHFGDVPETCKDSLPGGRKHGGPPRDPVWLGRGRKQRAPFQHGLTDVSRLGT
jgi:hypothetical protein